MEGADFIFQGVKGTASTADEWLGGVIEDYLTLLWMDEGVGGGRVDFAITRLSGMLLFMLLKITWECKSRLLKKKEVFRKMFKVKEPVGNKDKIRPRKRRAVGSFSVLSVSARCTKCSNPLRAPRAYLKVIQSLALRELLLIRYFLQELGQNSDYDDEII